jgi:hypothetical protein
VPFKTPPPFIKPFKINWLHLGISLALLIAAKRLGMVRIKRESLSEEILREAINLAKATGLWKVFTLREKKDLVIYFHSHF